MRQIARIEFRSFFPACLLYCFFLSCGNNPVSVSYYHDTPNEISIVSSDVSNFWEAYDSVTNGTLPNAREIFRNHYFGKASTGLTDYCLIKQLNDTNLCNAVFTDYPNFYKSIRTRTQEICSNYQKLKINRSFQIFDTIVPNAKFADIFYIVGNLSAGGKTTSHGIIISLEFFSADQNSDLDELPPAIRRLLLSFQKDDIVPAIATHELTHINQTRSNNNNLLLNQAIIEGAADFISFLVTGILLNSLSHQYGSAHEREVWNDFKRDMNFSIQTPAIGFKWIYNFYNFSPDKAPDLAYFVGYKVCESYYNNASDKTIAIRDILNRMDYEAILTESKYDPSADGAGAPR